MRKQFSKIAIVAVFGLALTFNFSCTEKSESKSSSSSEDALSSADVSDLPSDGGNQTAANLSWLGSFGFSDDKGQRIIIRGDNIEGLDIAIGYGGAIAEINFSGIQEGTGENNFRDTEYNFKNLPGYIFSKTKGELKSGQTYFLTNQSLKQSIIPLIPTNISEHKYASVDNATIKTIEKQKNRKIVASQLLAKTAAGAKICLFTFERIGDDMLASLVYVDGNKTIYDDYPAEYNETSVWRVDDNGILGGFDVLFLANAPSGKGLMLGFTSGGPEGENAYIVMEKDGIFVHTQYHNYRYLAPD